MACKRGLYSKSYCFFETLAERFKNYKLIKYSKIFSGTLIFFHCFLSYFKQILDSYFFSIQLNSVHNVSLATRFGGEQEHRRDFQQILLFITKMEIRRNTGIFWSVSWCIWKAALPHFLTYRQNRRYTGLS